MASSTLSSGFSNPRKNLQSRWQTLIRHLSINDVFLTRSQRLFLSWVILTLLISLVWVNPWVISLVSIGLVGVAINAYARGQALHEWIRRKWLLSIAGFLVWIVVYLQYRTVVGQNAGIAAISMLVALKLFEMDRRRDALILLFLAQVLVMGLFFVSQEIYAALCAIVMEVMLFAGQRTLFQNSRAATLWSWQGIKNSGILVGLSLILGALLFMVFPRPSEPLWNIGVPQSESTSGLSDTMKPGGVDQMSLSSEVAFSVAMQSSPPPPQKLYWRGPTLTNYRGGVWTMASSARMGGSNPAMASLIAQWEKSAPERIWRYTLTVEPQDRFWIYGLETLVSVADDKVTRSADGLWQNTQIISQRKSYAMVSVDLISSDFNVDNEEQIASALRFNLEPNRAEPQLRALAQRWREQALSENGESPLPSAINLSRYPALLPQKSAESVVAKALQFFSEENFVYALDQVRLPENNPMDYFLFQKRRGFCESYASAFTLLMRASGIPARVVTGYQGGEYNAISGVWVIRQSDAHAWSEVLINGVWRRVDPTAAVSPLRIEQSLSAAIPGAGGLPILSQANSASLLRRTMLAWEGLQTHWNRWVVQFDETKQLDFFNKLFWRGFGRGDLTLMTVGIIIVFFVLVYWRNRPQKPPISLENQWWNGVLHALQQRELPVRDSMTANEVLSIAEAHYQKPSRLGWGALPIASLRAFVRLLTEIKYAPHPQRPAILAQLKRLKRKIY